jgi:CheY-like chemotaxis protein
MKETEITVLLVEDSLGDARLVQEMLAGAENRRFHVQRADTLLAALEALAKTSFDVALVDLLLPDCTGLEALITIQLHAPELPIVVVTGLDSESAGLGAVEKGAQDYLAKGKFDADTLLRVMESAVVRRLESAGAAGKETGKALAPGIMGCKGEGGTTTIACQYGLEPRRRSGQAALPADLDSTTAERTVRVAPGTRAEAEGT